MTVTKVQPVRNLNQLRTAIEAAALEAGYTGGITYCRGTRGEYQILAGDVSIAYHHDRAQAHREALVYLTE